MPLPRPADMFGDAASSVEIAERFEAYKDELNKSFDSPVQAPGAPTMNTPVNQMAQLQKSLGSAEVSKALSPELLASVRESLAQADIGKDISLTSPLSTGLVAYDLEAPAKLLAPRPTPLRNRIARRQGIGTAHQFKRITGFTGSGTGGAAGGIMRPGITETTPSTAFGPTSYLRGPKISYAGDSQSVPYKQFSVSDQVSWASQFAGQGYQDIRQLSQTSVLYASMLLEERMLLAGRGTDAGFSGALATPTITGATRAAVTGETIISGAGTNLYVKVVAEGVWGTSVLSSAATITAASTTVLDVTVTNPGSATSFAVYVGTGSSLPADTALWFAGRTASSVITVSGALPTSGVAASTVTVSDTSASATDYDGLLSYCMGPNAGYVSRLNAPLSAAGGSSANNPGNEFNVAFASLYDSVKADPDEILANGYDRKQLSDLLKTQSSSSYRITVDNAGEAHNATIGAMVTGLQNEITGKVVDITVHPWLPQGTMPIVSWTLPLPDSNVSDVFAAYNVQDYMAIQWPVSQFSYDISSYWFGTFVCYAPAWCGAITGIKKV